MTTADRSQDNTNHHSLFLSRSLSLFSFLLDTFKRPLRADLRSVSNRKERDRDRKREKVSVGCAVVLSLFPFLCPSLLLIGSPLGALRVASKANPIIRERTREWEERRTGKFNLTFTSFIPSKVSSVYCGRLLVLLSFIFYCCSLVCH